MTQSNILFIGLDVHKESIEIVIAKDGIGGEVRHYGKVGGTLSAIDKVVRKLAQKIKRCIFVTKRVPVVMSYIVI